MRFLGFLFLCCVANCASFKILAIFPYNGRSHHIFYSALVEELAHREHDVTVINYHPVKKMRNLRQISLQATENTIDQVDVQEHLKVASNDILMAYDTAKAFKYIANTNCERLMTNAEVQELMKSRESYDVVIVEQFVTDCGFAVAHKLNTPTVGMTAHVLLPWTYSRLGAPSNPAFVANHLFASGSKPNLLNKIKSAIINFGMNMYYTHVIQNSDQVIVNRLYPKIPPLEELGSKMSLIMLNQFHPLTGPRIYGPNVIEIGGMHINQLQAVEDKELQRFLDTSDTGVVYISFGTVAANLPRNVIDAIKNMIVNSKKKFVWKTDLTDWEAPKNVYLAKWMPQVAVLCHSKVVAFISHSGMLSTSEAMHCGVPIVGVPLFGDQFANGASAVESGLGVTVDILTLKQEILENALEIVIQDKFQNRAKELSRLWKDRPLSPMNTTIYWIEHVARHKGAVNLRPPTVDMPFYQHMMLDVILVVLLIKLVLWDNLKALFGFGKQNKRGRQDRYKKRA